MKILLGAIMLLSLLGSLVATITYRTMNTTVTCSSTPTSEGAMMSLLSSDPQTAFLSESAPIPEKMERKVKADEITKSLELKKAREFLSKSPARWDDLGEINSSVEYSQPHNFGMSNPLTLSNGKDEVKEPNEKNTSMRKEIPCRLSRFNTLTQVGNHKTGEDKVISLLTIGMILILIVVGIVYIRKKK